LERDFDAVHNDIFGWMNATAADIVTILLSLV